ncbi:double-cubane-cluster-containing anaerobic reductase [Caminicella sporogenes]|uniref:double-cubane-cluster-containing anaerobic reductase n=1 Tax=Caminicella sporogenes TaxID=166485 RepID=UPI00253F7666|nr:double-cubane-cluster-containing anaerobic reductase [Caminicella sporogenes]WIF95619.1 double-cubane-cluster-containing anaerobic reductase [Caminicella sporogenes]
MADYREMWKSLDMDLEKHDKLCEVLPQFYEEIYLSQKNRPQGMNYFNFVVSEVHGLRIKELLESRKNNRKVIGSFCVYVPDEVINAADAISVGLCGGSDFWHPDGEKVLPRNTCPLVKASIGAKISATCPYFQSCDLLVGETTCDGKKKAWEILSEYTPIHVMDLPQMKREKDNLHWQDEIKIFIDKIENLTGNKINEENLAEGIKLINEKRRVLKRLYEFRKFDKLPISGKDVLLISQIAFYDDPKRFIEKTNELCDELEKRVQNGISVFEENTPRILITGTPMAIPNWKLHHIIESSGGAVVCEETCTGTRYFENLVDENGKTLAKQIKALSDRYLNINCACFTPNKGRIDDILRLYKEYNADGIVYFTLPFCTTYATEFKKVKDALDKKGIPVIMIETDYGLQDAGQIKTRLEAFFEMLETNKKVAVTK